jgi:hypothetical protein
MQAVDAAIERLEKRARDPRAITFGFATDLEVIANALREMREQHEDIARWVVASSEVMARLDGVSKP